MPEQTAKHAADRPAQARKVSLRLSVVDRRLRGGLRRAVSADWACQSERSFTAADRLVQARRVRRRPPPFFSFSLAAAARRLRAPPCVQSASQRIQGRQCASQHMHYVRCTPHVICSVDLKCSARHSVCFVHGVGHRGHGLCSVRTTSLCLSLPPSLLPPSLPPSPSLSRTQQDGVAERLGDVQHELDCFWANVEQAEEVRPTRAAIAQRGGHCAMMMSCCDGAILVRWGGYALPSRDHAMMLRSRGEAVIAQRGCDPECRERESPDRREAGGVGAAACLAL
jgi:hypothetical protein